ncbi:MAG: endonuclease III [Candidatus Moraniibacteriota bacterium]|nr:MAG: endonuclease III [Candidatus Moranbacteria bacterium]
MKKNPIQILQKLKDYYKETGPFASWSTPLELAVATILSAQCTDMRVNRVTPELFLKYKTAEAYAKANISDLEKIIYSTGYYKSKSRYVKEMGILLEKDYSGEIPRLYKELIRIPGISKKSACIIGAKAFRKFFGVAVDTHVARVAPRLGWSKSKNRDIISRDLEKIFPKKEYLNVNEYLIMLGRDVCIPRNPKCEQCILNSICPKKMG